MGCCSSFFFCPINNFTLLRRQRAYDNSVPAGPIPSFTFPGTFADSSFSSTSSMPPISASDFGDPTPLFPPDLFPGATQPAFHPSSSAPSWDSAPTWLPQSAPQTSVQWHETSAQPHWDDFTSCQPVPTRPPSTGWSVGDFFEDSYNIDLLMGAFPDEYSHSTFAPDLSSSADDGWSSRGWSSSSSRPVSAAPSSIYIPDEDAWSSRGWSSSSSRTLPRVPRAIC
ncbi:hypothetical protein DFH06DRAFT_390940 [Mycena polygramma]|nr:hypothetical protein DFH06DRAFT_390940 [Mycena polygramma]